MKTSKKLLSAALLIVFSVGLVSDLWAQRNVGYRSLAMRSQQEPVSFDFITLPGDNEKSVKFVSVFSLSYSYLPFKKMNQHRSGKQFYSPVSVSLEMFKSDNPKSKKNKENISVEGLEPAGRSFWSDTAMAETYKKSQSNKEFITGHLSVNLQPGSYNYVLQLKRGDQSDSRTSKTQVVNIESYDAMKVGNVIIGEKLVADGPTDRLQLTSMGNNVEYAKDFYALAYIPNYDENASYTLKVHSLNVTEGDTSKEGQTFSKQLNSNEIRTKLHPSIANANSKNYLNLNASDQGYAYALVEIPNSKFPNSFYRLVIEKEGQKGPVSEGKFRSLWIDMPASLYSLDVAVDMLHYIADEKTMDRLSSGTKAEREEKFREYWKKRDPTPDTEFNELMAEYYRRIDYAYENFSTENMIGYNSDQGEIYIKFGPPKNIERKYPTEGPTTEIWTYPNRKFIFRATTGFGDFELVSNQSR